VTSHITLVDSRTGFTDDRTWCFWDVQPHPYRHLIRERWSSWTFAGRGAVHRQRSLAMPYCHLPASSFYDDVLGRIRAAANCTLLLGTTVGAVDGRPGAVTVATSAGELTATHCFDALGTGGPTWGPAMPAPGPGTLAQRFLGWFVQAPQPVFDPSCVTLMDFDVTPNGELRFMYVLPFSATSALVEDTSIGHHGVGPEASRNEIRRYLRGHLGVDDVTVAREEHSVLPMIAGTPAQPAAPVIPVGTAAGALRPSSGYAFVRTQLQVGRIARAVAIGAPTAVPVERRREALLDRVFLEALQEDPAGFAQHMLSIGRNLAGDRFARFMMDAASPADVAAMVAALPKRSLLRAAGRTMAGPVRR
jgi:lycopene beta-cyclase